MQYYTFTSWQQVLDWIRENGLVRWCFAAERDKDGKMSQYVVISDWYPGNLDEKLATTRKMLEQQQGRYLYGTGWHNDNKTGGEVSCEVMLSAAQQGVGGFPFNPFMQQPQAQPVGELERQKIADQVRKEVLAEVERRQYEKEKAEFEKERKEFQKEKESAIGLAIGYLQPVIAALKDKMALANVAGTARDARRPVLAKPIQPITPEEPEQSDTNPNPDQGDIDGILDNNRSHDVSITDGTDTSEQDPFTDEEVEKLAELMARFKAVEPDYLQLLESVVEMAEKGDSTYTMARSILLK